ncbi:synaptotagmin-A-like [Ambystoma mexicanum]|uniref:synaptotagmin-A-like n=1 Tax=Ambystoma mexicanum TaxID=8296 RepID=UPI0037E7FE58
MSFLEKFELPFAISLKYGLLAFSLFIFLLALLILACQVYKYCKYSTAINRQEKKFLSGAYPGSKSESTILAKSLSPSLLDVSKKNHDVKIQKLQEEMEKLEVCLSPSPPSTEYLDGVGTEDDAQDVSRGTLRFSFLYTKKRMQLHLQVIEAKSLLCRGADLFIRIRVFCRESSHESCLNCILHEWETKVVKNNQNPSFGDEFTCSLRGPELKMVTVKMEVKGFDNFSRHSALGEVRVSLSSLKSNKKVEYCEELQKVTKDIVGEVLISMKCLPTAQRIEVGLLKVKCASLKSSPQKDVYARIDVFGNQRKQKHQKSTLRAKSSVIVFNETFQFTLPDPVARGCVVLLSLYQVQASGKSLIGQASLESNNNEDDHWQLMMQSARQPVAKWHPLLI